MQITGNNTQTSFGVRNIKVGNITGLGEKTANAIAQALPDAYKLDGKNIDLIIDDYKNINPDQSGIFVKAVAVGKKHLLNIFKEKQMPSYSSHTQKPLENKNDILKQIVSTIRGLRANSMPF